LLVKEITCAILCGAGGFCLLLHY